MTMFIYFWIVLGLFLRLDGDWFNGTITSSLIFLGLIISAFPKIYLTDENNRPKDTIIFDNKIIDIKANPIIYLFFTKAITN